VNGIRRTLSFDEGNQTKKVNAKFVDSSCVAVGGLYNQEAARVGTFSMELSGLESTKFRSIGKGFPKSTGELGYSAVPRTAGLGVFNIIEQVGRGWKVVQKSTPQGKRLARGIRIGVYSSKEATDNNRIGEDELLRRTAFKGIVGFADAGRVELREIKDGPLKNSGIYKGAPSWAIYRRY